MTLFQLLALLAVVAAVAAVVSGRVGGGLSEPTSTRPYRPLPDGDLTPDDVAAVRFSLGLRGYRMDEVDEVLDRLEAEIGELRWQVTRARAGADAGAGPVPVVDARPVVDGEAPGATALVDQVPSSGAAPQDEGPAVDQDARADTRPSTTTSRPVGTPGPADRPRRSRRVLHAPASPTTHETTRDKASDE